MARLQYERNFESHSLLTLPVLEPSCELYACQYLSLPLNCKLAIFLLLYSIAYFPAKRQYHEKYHAQKSLEMNSFFREIHMYSISHSDYWGYLMFL